MMTQGSDVDQILFGLTPKGGLGIRQYSLGLTDHQVDLWADRLGKYNRLTPTFVDHRPWVPRQAFSYFEFADGTAALLARFKTGESGRNSSHALVGSAKVLGPSAMALSTWDRWCAGDAGAALPRVNPNDWSNCETWWQDKVQLDSRNRTMAGIALVREVLLGGEATHFTVLADIDEPLPLLALARTVLDPVAAKFGEASWTFSTYEESDTTLAASSQTDGAPHFWFVRALPTSGQTDRRRVLIDQRPDDDAYSGLAAELVTNYLQNPSGYPATIEEELYGISRFEDRVARLLDRYPRSRVPVPAREPAPLLPAVEEPHVSMEEGRHAGGMAVTRKQPAPRSMDVDQLLTTLYEGDGLTRQETCDYVTELRNQWNSRNPYVANVTHMVNRVEKRLTLHERVLGVAVVGLVLVALLAFLTARREVSVPTPPTVTVTYTPPQPAQPPDGER
jgi:hypothetical protein